MSSYIANLVKLGATVAATWIVAQAAHIGLHLSGEKQVLVAIIGGLATTAVVGLIGQLERRFPWLKHFLVVRKPGAVPPGSSGPAAR